jgi:hypothetical protein
MGLSARRGCAMSNPWFRFYAEFAGDPVVQSLAFEDQRHFVVLLCLKCNGTLDRPMDPKVRDRIICRGIGLDPVAAAEARRRLEEVGLIDESWQPSGWNNRQFVSDNSTPRVAKHRKNKASGNVSETLRERFGNAPDTDTDTDTDKGTSYPSSKDGEAPSSRHVPQCPHRKIIALYHEILPELPGIVVSLWGASKDAEALKSRWGEDKRHQDLDFWRRFFSTVRQSDRWMGNNNIDWRADLRWLVKRANFIKVVERMANLRRAANG